MIVPNGYVKLADVLSEALNQAAFGKGKERHACGQPFHEQQICQLSRWLGSADYDLGQACKKLLEVNKLPTIEQKVAEILGAINYAAAAVIVLREGAEGTGGNG